MTLLDKIKAAFKKPEINPGDFNDPIAEKISWAPLNGGGTNFKTRKFVQVNPNRVEFKKTIMMKIFPWIFICFPIIVFSIILYNGEIALNSQNIASPENLVVLVPFVFIGGGIFLLLKTNKSIVFDKRYGYYWKGKSEPETYNLSANKNFIRLSDIHAIQLIREYIRSSSGSSSSGSSYYSYELNLILKDERRINVIDHGHKRSIIEDSQLLSDFLHVPVWNAL